MRQRYLERISLRFVCLVLVQTVCLISSSHADEILDKSIKPNADVQKEINRVVSLLARPQLERYVRSEEVTSEQYVSFVIDEFKSFQDMATGDLLLQVLLAYGGKIEHRANPKNEMAKRILIFHLSREIPAGELVSLIGPHIEKTTEPMLKNNLEQVLLLVALKEDTVNPDFVEFNAYLKKQKDTPPLSLIEFMYRVGPDGAVVAMARLHEGKTSAEKLRKDLKVKVTVPSTLESFSKSNKWWENLYAVEKMKKVRSLRSSAVIERLKKSKHPLVQKAIKQLE